MFLVPALPLGLSSWLYVPGAVLTTITLVLAVWRGGHRLLAWLKEQGNAEALDAAQRALAAATESLHLAEQTADNWQAYAQSQEPLITMLQAQVKDLQVQVGELRSENTKALAVAKHLDAVVTWLRARVAQLEAALRREHIPVPPPESPEPQG